MRNPYEVLGINEGATEDQIKKAYRDLAKKFHPDQYGNNPLKDLAEEKMREINEAYDTLMKKNSGHNGNYNSADYSQSKNSSYSSNNNDSYYSIRMDINNGNMAAAEQKLNKINVRDAEWNFLMGSVCLRKGWYDNAYKYISLAYKLEPQNPEYSNAFNSLNRQNNSYRDPYFNRGGNDRDDCCNLCIQIWCAEQICSCLGGGC